LIAKAVDPHGALAGGRRSLRQEPAPLPRTGRLSQEELGYRAQLHRTQVGSLERGVRTPRIDTVLRLAGSLSAPVSDLLAGLEWMPGYVEIVGGGFEIAERPELKAA
jgi:transcriptional regulator with XRE-family HTH domain